MLPEYEAPPQPVEAAPELEAEAPAPTAVKSRTTLLSEEQMSLAEKSEAQLKKIVAAQAELRAVEANRDKWVGRVDWLTGTPTART